MRVLGMDDALALERLVRHRGQETTTAGTDGDAAAAAPAVALLLSGRARTTAIETLPSRSLRPETPPPRACG